MVYTHWYSKEGRGFGKHVFLGIEQKLVSSSKKVLVGGSKGIGLEGIIVVKM